MTLLNKKKISLVLFQGDGLSIMDIKFIKLIDNRVKKGIFSWDDPMYHHLNRITASACDFVLSGVPNICIKISRTWLQSFISSCRVSPVCF